MKNRFRNYLTLVVLTFTFLAIAQAPQKMSYQSVIRNVAGDLVTNSPIGLRISILKDSPSGIVVYSETMTNTTNENGLLSIEIGGGTPITGTFAGIDWSTGTFFVKTETDPNGGTNYDVVGTSQLLSVPYALYAEKTRNTGKITIFLTDDITDAEAAAQIASELGPNTENIYIQGTNQLTTVDLSGATTLSNIQIDHNDVLTTINLSNVTKIYKHMDINSNPLLTTLNFSSLIHNPSETVITSNETLNSISFSNLTRVNNLSIIQIDNNSQLTSINFNTLDTMSPSGNISIISNVSLSSLSFPQLLHMGQMTIQFNSNLSTINCNSVSTIAGLSIEENDAINNLAFPSLVSGNLNLHVSNLSSLNLNAFENGYLGLFTTKLTSFSLPSFTSGFVDISSNGLLENISLPLLASSEKFTIQNNPQLNSITIPNLTSVSNPDIQLNNNSLLTPQVNYLLNKLVSVAPPSGKNINLMQIPAAPPTGQGLIDKQTLINNGNTVTTD